VTAGEMVRRCRIVAVAEALGLDVKRGRCRAAWRNGDGWNVALDDERGAWYDFVGNDSGGVLALIERCLGCERREAAEWLASYMGARLDDGPASFKDRRQMARQRAQDAADSTAAGYWQSQYLAHLEAVLAQSKARLDEHLAADEDPPELLAGPVASLTAIHGRIRAARGGELLRLYRWFRDADPERVAAFVAEGKADAEHAGRVAAVLVAAWARAMRRAA
jgi:hypothetical protein